MNLRLSRPSPSTGETQDDDARKLFRETNARVSKLADDQYIFYLDLTDRFLEKDGRIAKTTMPDFLHLSPGAYQVWAEAMEPTIKKLLDEQ